MAALEELVSQTGEMRVPVLCIYAILQNPVNILAMLHYVKRGVIQLLFSAYLWARSAGQAWGITGQRGTNAQGRPPSFV